MSQASESFSISYQSKRPSEALLWKRKIRDGELFLENQAKYMAPSKFFQTCNIMQKVPDDANTNDIKRDDVGVDLGGRRGGGPEIQHVLGKHSSMYWGSV